MPRVRVSLPDELLQRAATLAEADGKTIHDLYTEAVTRYVETNQNARPGSMRSRSGIPRGSPTFTVELPEDLFQQAEKLAKRHAKRRDVLYAEAVARHIMHTPGGDSAFDQGHDLPSGAWRPKGAA